jgi:general secretion pathway protein A
MKYFKILNLIREPFSNSPEPEFFFQSPKHVSCLQKLELAIRLRRGLNVVMGHVGTGKTTLCRHLILQFATANDEADPVETHLLMDPAFTTPLEFLSTVALSFGITEKQKKQETADTETSEWQLKENIKDYLLKRGVDEKKIVVLIVDEGQKLPDFCLEILREFLNFETNENKLLQIVIFAQKEFQQILDRMENFADRVNLLYMLEPLNFQETRDMIQFRLTRAGTPGNIPALFTSVGLLAVYQATGGYPRKIVTLCHQVILALIIQNRKKAGWFLVRSCAHRLASAGQSSKARLLRWVPGILIVFLVAMTLIIAPPIQDFWVWYDASKTAEEATRKVAEMDAMAAKKVAEFSKQTGLGVKTIHEMAAVVSQGQAVRSADGKTWVLYTELVKKSTDAVKKETDAQETARYPVPDYLGKLALKNGRTIWRLLSNFYGKCDQNIFSSVARANPHIKNLSRVKAGETIHLPALPVKRSPLPPNKYWVQLVASKNLEETYELYKTYQPTLPSLRFIPYWNPRQGVVLSITLKDGYPDEASAAKSIARLPIVLASGARVLKNLDKDTVFYTR